MADLVAVFVPPLADVLAAAERAAGHRLTAAEVATVRDRAVAMMVPAAAARALEAERGFRDVDPEDVWADWHRLRVEKTGDGCLPRIVLCILGGASFGATARVILERAGLEHEVRGRDPRMARAFAASEVPADPSLEDADLDAVRDHGAVVYALSPHFGAGGAIDAAGRMLALARELLDAGGTAMKCESSGIAHGRGRWLELAAASAGADDARRLALLDALVQGPIASRTDYTSCGMHLVGRPDLVVARDVASDREALRVFRTFASYLLVECDARSFRSGHTFRCDRESPRYVVRWEPCTGYEEDDFFFNPFGRLRFAPA